MNNRPFMIMILAVLLVQPFVVVVSAPATMILGLPDSDSSFVVAQGTRLSPGELSNHVPFTIDGTADFGLQGWPGAGTPANPYVISGLNITTDSGFVLIEILNTNASFVIRDCYLVQNATEAVIRFENTSAGTIEYTTIYGGLTPSAGEGAIRIHNANNTVVTHVMSYGIGDMALFATDSNHLTLTSNLFDSAYHRAARAQTSDYLTIDDCEFYSYASGYWCTRWWQVNHTTITNSRFYTDGISGISIDTSYFSSISNVYIKGSNQDGLNIDNCPNITVTHATIEETQSFGVAVDNSPGFVFTDSSVTDAGSRGVDIDTCPNSTLSNINITMPDLEGLNIMNSDNTTATGITVSYATDLGVGISSSSFLILDGFTLTNIDGNGIYIQNCNDGSLTNAVLDTIYGSGISFSNAHNWTVTDNLVEYVDNNGIRFFTGDNLLLTRNFVNYCGDEGIYVDTSDNSEVIDNHVTMSDSTGMVVSTCDNMTFAGNTVDYAWDGCSVDNGVNVTIEGNILTNLLGRGISISGLDDSVIRNNVFEGVGEVGMDIDYLLTSSIEDNQLTGFGFWFNPTRAYSYYNNTVVNNTVNGKDIYYSLDEVGVVLTASDYAQFIIINGSHFDIHDGTFERVTNPFMFILSDNCSVWQVTTTDNYYAIYYDRTGDGVVHHVTIDGGGGYGILARLSDEFNLSNSTIYNCDLTNRQGLGLYSSDAVIVSNCEFDRNYRGIYITDVNDGLITDNMITNSESYAISIWSSSSYYLRILNNEIYNATYGVYHEHADNVTISMNTIMYTTIWGIYVAGSGSQDVNVTLNEVSNNDDGIAIHNNGNSFVMNNTVMWNDGYGIYSDPFTPAEFYYNIIALNRGDNGLDETNGNFWDDGVSMGNWWDDYTPPGVYNVDGNTDDRYPMQFLPTKPIISQPQDIYYPEGSEGNEILWYAYDDSLGDWAVTIDGNHWASDAWNFDNITVNIDGLPYGTHTVVVTVWDIHDNNATDTVLVHVYDDTAPTIGNVPNGIAFVDATNQVLTWQVNDLHPDTYTVFLDGEEFATGTWTSGTLDFNIDDIPEGEHTLVMRIADLDGNTASDPVLLNVILDNVNPVIDSPDDISYEVGTTGNVITWNPSDDYPATYEIADQSSVLAEGAWGGSRVVFIVDGLAVGTYRFQITVTDGSGNSAEDFVNVEVTAVPTEPPPPLPPLDLGLVGLVVGGIGVVAVVIILIYVIRKKKTPY